MVDVKCKHCRKLLFNDRLQLLTAHCEVKNNTNAGCDLNDRESCSYLSSDNMPDWIELIIAKEAWTKGRLHCPECNNRIGAFNFVNEFKCNCGQFITPPIRLINSKVDIIFVNK